MPQPVISIRNLGKRYRIGKREANYLTLRDAVSDLAMAPLRRLRNAFRSGPPDEDADDHIWALRDVSLDIEPGEVVGIIGRNGAGKTTLLKVLSRITEPTEGCVGINGRVASLLEVGTGFHHELTGRENIYLNGAILGMKKAEIDRKFDEIVAFAEIEKFMDTPVKRYSSGMYVRLAFAVAAHLEPEVLLVDEVLAVGDAAFQKKCLGKMEDVSKQGRTVLFVSHNMFTLQNLCTRGVLLDAGRVVTGGGIREVTSEYLDMGREQAGEVSWTDPENAPGGEHGRLKAVRVVCDGETTGDADIARPLCIEIDYWNLEANTQRWVSIHLHNALGECVLTSANFPSVSEEPDPWYSRPYPLGLFRTACTIPGNLLNDGLHTISVYINQRTAEDHVVVVKDALTFMARDTGAMRHEYTGKWIGAVRPILGWHTVGLQGQE